MKNLMRILSLVAVVAFMSACNEEVKPAKALPAYADDQPPKTPCAGGGNCN